MNLDVSLIPEGNRNGIDFRKETLAAFEKGDVDGMTLWMDSHNALEFTFVNMDNLIARGVYEQMLLDAFTGTNMNHSGWSADKIHSMFLKADRDKLQKLGDHPIPLQRTNLYRGIAGKGRSRRPRGLSWTDSLDLACWFAMRPSLLDPRRLPLGDPCILTATVKPIDIFVCHFGRGEREYICRPKRPKNLNLSEDEIALRAKSISDGRAALKAATG